MKKVLNGKNLKNAAVGALAGLVNGFLGTGGGIVLIFAGNRSEDDGKDARDVFASTLLVTMIFSVISATVYSVRGKFPLKEAFSYAPTAIIGGIIGALLLDKLPKKTLNIIFSVLVVIAGAIMIFK